MLWLTGGALAVCTLMIVGLLGYIFAMGLITLWPGPIEKMTLLDGTIAMGEAVRSERYELRADMLAGMPEEIAAAARRLGPGEHAGDQGPTVRRRLIRTGNYELTRTHFRWVDDFAVAESGVERPAWALLLERTEWGRFYGFPERFLVDGEAAADEPGDVWKAFLEHHGGVRSRRRERQRLEKHDLGRSHRRREDARLHAREIELERGFESAWTRAYVGLREAERRAARMRREAASLPQEERQDAFREADELAAAAGVRLDLIERSFGRPPEEDVAAYAAAWRRYDEVVDQGERDDERILARIAEIARENGRYAMVLRTADGVEKTLALDQIVRAFPPNRLSLPGRTGVYLSRWRELLLDEPREANQEGGIFPAIVGTVIMTVLMAIAVVPFGVMAALYLREYARAGPVVSAVRISINNLAGVPSIVFGVFGLGFFCYGVGSYLDGGPAWRMPAPSWFLMLGGVVAAGAAGFAAFLLGMRRPGQRPTARRRFFANAAGLLWFAAALTVLGLAAATPFFDGFYRARLPNPTFGKGALVWASLTLALLTLPVVIVATEEALAAVPNSVREGSYACGASKWQTIRRIVLPRAMPGIMTGMILAMARGAGEVAPLMLVGAVKLAPELPLAARFPFGLNRSFMHLGFHIYDLGFQSPNAEAAKPMVFTTTFLLILIIAVLNMLAVWLRARLRRKFLTGQF